MNNRIQYFSIIFIILIYSTFTGNAYSQNGAFDTKYTVEYVLKDIHGNEIGRMKMYRNNDKIKFSKIDNKGKENEVLTDIYVLKNEQMVYTIVSSKKLKLGTKHQLDANLVGMATGVYIFDLGNDGTVFNASTRNGNQTVLGKDCTVYTLLTTADGGSYYCFYQDNLTFKHFAQTSTDGGTLEAISYDNTTEIPDSFFTVPTDVQYLEN